MEKIAEAEGMGRQQNRNDAIILFNMSNNMSNARYVRIVGTARNTNQRPTSPAVKDKNSKSAKISLKKIEVLWFMT